MERNPLRTLAEIAAIIACIIAVLTFFNIQPSCSGHKDVSNPEVQIPTTEQRIEDSIDIEDIINPISNNETELSINTSDDFSLWGLIKLPFVKHQKKNYFKCCPDNKHDDLWAFVIILIMGLISLDMFFWEIINDIDLSKDWTGIFGYLIAAVPNIIVGWYMLVFLGVF